jgi:ABC-type multidrug transport system ATPase subunit
LERYKYKNSKRIGFVDRLHYKYYKNLTIGQYLKRIVKINGKTNLRLYDNKDCINHYVELTENSTEENIDKLIKIFRKAGCIFDGYSINPRS